MRREQNQSQAPRGQWQKCAPFFDVLGGMLIGLVLGGVAALLLSYLICCDNTTFALVIFLFAGPIGAIVGVITGGWAGWRIHHFLYQPDPSGRLRGAKTRLVLGLIFNIPGVLAAMCWGIWYIQQPVSDHYLVDNFEQHQRDFNQLVQMVSKDKGIESLYRDEVSGKNNTPFAVSRERMNVYRKLLDTIHAPGGLTISPSSSEIELIYWGYGSPMSDDAFKGYCYLPTPPQSTVPSLDEIHLGLDENKTVYRHLRGNWYLYYRHLDG